MVRGLPADVERRLSRPGAERRAGHGGAAAVGRGGGAVALVAYRSYIGVAVAAVAAVLMVGLIVGVVLMDRPGAVVRGEMAEARVLHTATALADGRVLVVGGKARYGSCEIGSECHDPSASAEIYDPASGVISAAAEMSVHRVCPGSISLADGRVLVTGGALVTNAALLERGGTGGALRMAEVYDPAANTWSSVGATEIERYCPVGVRLRDGRALLTGGLIWRAADYPMAVADTFELSSGEGVSADAMNDPRVGHKAVLLRDGRVLVIGGGDHRLGHRWNALASSELYDPSTDRWTRTGDMGERVLPRPLRCCRTGECCSLTGPYWWQVGNVDEESGISHEEVFDPRSGTWSAVEEMDAVRLSHSMVSIPGGRVVVFGGSDTPDGSGHSTSEVYDPVTGRWSRY